MAQAATTLNLDGTWEYLPDPNGTLQYADLAARADWQTMAIPNNWHLAGLPDYAGIVWFRRHFDAPPELTARACWLRLEGVDYFAEVWLNGHLLGGHEGYFQPFELRASQHLVAGDNELVVRVEAPREEPGKVWPNAKRVIKGILSHHDCRPGAGNPEWGQSQCTGGIWNQVLLVSADRARILDTQVTTRLRPDNQASISITVELQNLADSWLYLEVSAVVRPANFAGEERIARRTLRLQPGTHRCHLVITEPDPHLWTTWDLGDSTPPALYMCAMTIALGARALDTRIVRFGIREVTVSDGWRWQVNGQELFIRGVNIIPTQWLAEYTPERIAHDIRLLREANVNCARVHAHVNRREFYDACDEAGILVWQDFALQWGYEESDEFTANAMAQIRDMVRLLYNHPSIALWCCHNEPTHNRHTLDPVLAAVAMQEDSTRAVVEASDFRQHPYPGWYYGDIHDFAGLPGAPFPTEFGAQALPGREELEAMLGANALWPTDAEGWKVWAYHDFQYDTTFNVARIARGSGIDEFIANSQRYQAQLLQRAIEHYRAARPRVTGMLMFMFVDCWPAITWSVLDYHRRPKLGYAALQRAYQPILPIIKVSRYEIEIGSLLFFDAILVVNDLPVTFEGARLALELRSATGTTSLGELPIDIPANQAQTLIIPWELIEQPSNVVGNNFGPIIERLSQLAPGDYTLVTQLFDAQNRPLSENRYELRFIAPVVPSRMIM
jgi:beta-mannosidase